MQLLFLTMLFVLCQTEDNYIKILFISQKGQEQYLEWYNKFISSYSSQIKIETVIIDQEDMEVCNSLTNGGNLVLDISWFEDEEIRSLLLEAGVPYIKLDVSLAPFLNLLDGYLDLRNATDVTFIFEDPSYIDQTLYFWMNSAKMRMLMTETLNAATVKKLKYLRPMPNNYALLASTDNMNKLFKTAMAHKLVMLPERWNLIFLDFNYIHFEKKYLQQPLNLLHLSPEMCCSILNKNSYCDCPDDFNLKYEYFIKVLRLIFNCFNDLIIQGRTIPNYACNTSIANNQFHNSFEEMLNNYIENDGILAFNYSKITLKTYGVIQTAGNKSRTLLAKYDNGAVITVENRTIKPIKSFYGIGVAHAIPWSYKELDPVTGKWIWTGYCIDFARKLAEILNFDYQLVEPKEGTFGKKINGVWNGVVGDLVSGRTDLAITTLIMTADKEEVIDFVAPYFEQTGITIVMRKPVRKTSLFKFMTVLKLEVWFSIVAALVVTGFMVWFLDKYSPYSARNNKKAYPYPCREFTLKESFWFALTSFTPQGGGEAPKALSGRTLVAAYWLFVVLMLATFTANLAAFLTVERMQAPVQSLEQLARQSRINYTVVANSQTHQYFINMKFAEDTLYRMWKELTLNASNDDNRYRVWDYPIKEQYGHILLAINDSNPVKDAEEGFKNVNEHLDADYAFIHDSSSIKYEISRNCNLTEVGEVFAERPYAVAVQQGSHLQDDISKTILKLQKDRFFEGLQEKYWNHSSKGDCPSTDDNEGITLESLGGVFIATLFGLALAMITLAGEVFYYRRKQVKDNKVVQVKQPSNKAISTISSQFYPNEINPIKIAIKPADIGRNFNEDSWKNPSITLYPKGRNRIDKFKFGKH
ncbi:uncharacterized protein LOC130894392 isoform X2 [Diorhabda carinulata]|uniref:uncharacterized protein LOC130894392 isoform X2 n=1 Tax=Diorhabda carinulata TaxID=1163345 RepID=UPI0025A160E9|nr:uncharacterized protein LOC130894392 isoform X2 [Diorhabda carinulata]